MENYNTCIVFVSNKTFQATAYDKKTIIAAVKLRGKGTKKSASIQAKKA